MNVNINLHENGSSDSTVCSPCLEKHLSEDRSLFDDNDCFFISKTENPQSSCPIFNRFQFPPLFSDDESEDENNGIAMQDNFYIGKENNSAVNFQRSSRKSAIVVDSRSTADFSWQDFCNEESDSETEIESEKLREKTDTISNSSFYEDEGHCENFSEEKTEEQTPENSSSNLIRKRRKLFSPDSWIGSNTYCQLFNSTD